MPCLDAGGAQAPRASADGTLTGVRPLRCETIETSRREALRCVLRGLAAALAGGLASACSALPGLEGSAPSAPQPGTAASGGSTIGTGAVKIGLLLPLSASGAAGAAALTLRNSAELSVAEFQNPNIQLLVKDDRGTPEGAREAAQQAIAEGAELIIGPLFAASVQAAAQVAGPPTGRSSPLHRCQRRLARRLPAELHAGERGRARRQLRRSAGAAVIRGADSPKPPTATWSRRPSSNPLSARGRPRRGAGALSRRQGQDGGAG